MREILIEIMLGCGAFFAFLAAVGLLRLPDVYMRLSANSKAATLGTSFLLGAGVLHFGSLAVTAKIAAIILFLMLTAPVAAHMIGRAAYYGKVPLWKETVCDELGRSDNDRTEEEGEKEAERGAGS